MSVIGKSPEGIDIWCTGKGTHKRYRVGWILENYPGSGRSPTGPGVELVHTPDGRIVYRLICRRDRRRCRQDVPLREESWRRLVAGLDAAKVPGFDLSSMPS